MIRPAATLAIVLAAATALAQPDTPADEQPNAAEGYRYAWALLRPHDLATIEAHYGRDEPMPDEVVRLLESGPTPKAIRYILIASEMDACRWPDDPAVEPMVEPHLRNAGQTMRLLAVDAERCRLEGGVEAAARRTAALTRLADQIMETTAGRGPDFFVWMRAANLAHAARESLDADLDAGPPSRAALRSLEHAFRGARSAVLIPESSLMHQVGLDVMVQRRAILVENEGRLTDDDVRQLIAELPRTQGVIDAYLGALDAPDVEDRLEALRRANADDTRMTITVEHLDAAREGWIKATTSLRNDLDHADAAIAAALQETDP